MLLKNIVDEIIILKILKEINVSVEGNVLAKTGATYYQEQCISPDKNCAIKEWVVCNLWDVLDPTIGSVWCGRSHGLLVYIILSYTFLLICYFFAYPNMH